MSYDSTSAVDRYSGLPPDTVLVLTVQAFENDGPFIDRHRDRLFEDLTIRHSITNHVISRSYILSFSKPPRQSRSYFTIGRGPHSDISCSSTSVSAEHIRFSVEGKHVVLEDVSTIGCTLAFGSRGEHATDPGGLQRPYRCIIPPNCGCTLRLPNSLTFTIWVPQFSDAKLDEFHKLRRAFLSNCSSLRGLNIQSQVTNVGQTPGKLAPTKQRYMYWFKHALGKGGYGAVHLVYRLQDWKRFAAKEVIASSLKADPKAVKVLEEEMERLQSFKHERVVSYEDWYEDKPGHWVLVMEYCEFGSLFDLMECRRDTFQPQEIAEILKQIAEGLVYLYGQGCAHRDLKPHNILLRQLEPLSLVLADFGLSKQKTDGDSRMRTFLGTYDYMAPEILAGKPYNSRVDIWALGVIGLELLDYRVRKARQESQSFPVDRLFKAARTLFKGDRSNLLAGIVTRMLAGYPEDRPDARKCFEDAVTALNSLGPREPVTAPPYHRLPHLWDSAHDSQATLRLPCQPTIQDFTPLEIQEMERQLETSSWRVRCAARLAEHEAPMQPSSQTMTAQQEASRKRGAGVLSRSNSIEARPPKHQRTEPTVSMDQEGTLSALLPPSGPSEMHQPDSPGDITPTNTRSFYSLFSGSYPSFSEQQSQQQSQQHQQPQLTFPAVHSQDLLTIVPVPPERTPSPVTAREIPLSLPELSHSLHDIQRSMVTAGTAIETPQLTLLQAPLSTEPPVASAEQEINGSDTIMKDSGYLSESDN